MFMVDKTMLKNIKNKIAIILCFLALIIFTLNLSVSNFAYNFEYVNVTSKVNITNAYPVITSIIIDQNIVLNAGSTKLINCNVSLYDWNGANDIVKVNATLWDNNSVNYTDPLNNNTLYFNSSCLNVTANGYYANYTCSFDVWYYAKNGSNWICNATVIDNYNFTDYEYNLTTINSLFAINVTPTIDFGDMAVGDIKNNITANVTNFGNMPINVSVNGFGETPGDGLAMKCAIRNISIDNMKFSINGTETWTQKTNLSTTLKNITGLTVPKRTADMTWNTTYWDLYIPPSENPFGICNGTVVFTAIAG